MVRNRGSFAERRRELRYHRGANRSTEQPSRTVVKVTLSDCLSCSGCITSSEDVFIHSQGVDAFKKLLATDIPIVVSVAPQSLGVLAALSGETGILTVLSRVRAFFSRYYPSVAAVVTTECGQRDALAATLNEAQQRPRLIVASCPGVVSLVEKKYPHFVPFLSRVGSPMVLTGRRIKLALDGLGLKPGEGYHHVSIQPCFDRKLEPSRSEIGDLVQLVLTATEYISLAMELTESSVASALTAVEEGTQQGSIWDALEAGGLSDTSCFSLPPSGGYADLVASTFTESPTPEGRFKILRSGSSASAAVYGPDVERFLKDMSDQNGVWELMACRGGCTHGGGLVPSGLNAPQVCGVGETQVAASAYASAGEARQCLDDVSLKEVSLDIEDGASKRERERASHPERDFSRVLVDW